MELRDSIIILFVYTITQIINYFYCSAKNSCYILFIYDPNMPFVKQRRYSVHLLTSVKVLMCVYNMKRALFFSCSKLAGGLLV